MARQPARDPERRPTRWWHWLLYVGLAVVLTLAVGLALVGVLLQTSWGQARVADRLGEVVSGEIPGRMQIGSIEGIDPYTEQGLVKLQAREIVFASPSGPEVISTGSADLWFDPGAALSEELHFEGMDIDGGTVSIDPGPSDRTTIENTFDAPGSGPKPRPFAIDLRAMFVEDMRLEVSTNDSEDHEFVLENIDGIMGIFQSRTAEGVTVQFDEMSGALTEPSYLGEQAVFRRIDGEIRGKAERSIDLDFTAAVLGGTVDGNFALLPDADKRVHLTLDPEGKLVALAALAANLRSEFGGDVKIDIE